MAITPKKARTIHRRDSTGYKKTYLLEVDLPSQNKIREESNSNSNDDSQQRLLEDNIKVHNTRIIDTDHTATPSAATPKDGNNKQQQRQLNRRKKSSSPIVTSSSRRRRSVRRTPTSHAELKTPNKSRGIALQSSSTISQCFRASRFSLQKKHLTPSRLINDRNMAGLAMNNLGNISAKNILEKNIQQNKSQEITILQ